MFAAAVLVKLSAVTAAPTLVVLLRSSASGAGGGCVEAAIGAAVLVAVLAILYARDLRGIWDGAFGYHLDTTGVNGLSGRHQLANFFDTSLHTVFLWFTVAGLAASVAVWRRVWFLWLWPACAVAFVLTYQPLRDNHLILIPYSFAVPIAVALGLVRSGFADAGSRRPPASRSRRCAWAGFSSCTASTSSASRRTRRSCSRPREAEVADATRTTASSSTSRSWRSSPTAASRRSSSTRRTAASTRARSRSRTCCARSTTTRA